jgi:hypothetical protein
VLAGIWERRVRDSKIKKQFLTFRTLQSDGLIGIGNKISFNPLFKVLQAL